MSKRKARARAAIKKAMPNQKAIYKAILNKDMTLREVVYGLIMRPNEAPDWIGAHLKEVYEKVCHMERA